MTTKPTFTSPLEMAMAAMSAAVADWENQHTPETLKAQAIKVLENKKQEMLLKLLGFEHSFGEWRVDHCNGRSGESAAGDYLRSAQQQAIKEWLASVSMPKLTPSLKNKFEKELQREFETRVQYAMRAIIEQKAKDFAAEYMKSLEANEFIDGFLKTRQLLKGSV